MATDINANELKNRLTGENKILKITNKAEQVVAKANLKNSAKLQLAIAYLFHEIGREIGELTIDVGNGTIIEGENTSSPKTYTINDDVLTANAEFPITARYQKASADLIAAGFVTDGNFYDGFFSMFDGKATSAPAKKPTTKKSKRGGKKH